MFRVKHSQTGILAAFALTVWFGPGTAYAHIKLKSPTPQVSNNPQKDAPCGPSSSSRGTTMTMFAPGQKIMVEWDETIQHPGHYRIAFDSDGQDFPDPMSFTDIATEKKDLGKGVIVLADGIKDMTGPVVGNTPYKTEVTLPDVECSNCTLQLIQVMTDKAPYGNGDDIYHDCANLVLKRPAGAAAGSGGSPSVAGTGAGGAGAGTGAAGSGVANAGTAAMGFRPAGGAGVGSAGGAGASGAAGQSVVAGTAAIAGTGGPLPNGMPQVSEGCAVSAVGVERGEVVVGAMVVLAVLVGRRRRRRA